MPLDEETAKHCNFQIIGGKATGTYRFVTGFYWLTIMPTEFQSYRSRIGKPIKYIRSPRRQTGCDKGIKGKTF